MSILSTDLNRKGLKAPLLLFAHLKANSTNNRLGVKVKLSPNGGGEEGEGVHKRQNSGFVFLRDIRLGRARPRLGRHLITSPEPHVTSLISPSGPGASSPASVNPIGRLLRPPCHNYVILLSPLIQLGQVVRAGRRVFSVGGGNLSLVSATSGT